MCIDFLELLELFGKVKKNPCTISFSINRTGPGGGGGAISVFDPLLGGGGQSTYAPRGSRRGREAHGKYLLHGGGQVPVGGLACQAVSQMQIPKRIDDVEVRSHFVKATRGGRGPRGDGKEL